MLPARLWPLAAIACFLVAPAVAQQSPTVEILAPSAGAELTGTVQVRVKITTPAGQKPPTAVFFGIGTGPPWVPMQATNQAGEWVAETDSTMIPNGPHNLMVITNNKKLKASIRVTTKNPLKVFFAGLHSHTCYSDGTLTPAAAHEYARDVAGLDLRSPGTH